MQAEQRRSEAEPEWGRKPARSFTIPQEINNGGNSLRERNEEEEGKKTHRTGAAYPYLPPGAWVTYSTRGSSYAAS
jgi:hypothetical protein